MNEGSRYPRVATNDLQTEKRRPCPGVCDQLGPQKLCPGTLISPWSLLLDLNDKVVTDIFLVLP